MTLGMEKCAVRRAVSSVCRVILAVRRRGSDLIVFLQR